MWQEIRQKREMENDIEQGLPAGKVHSITVYGTVPVRCPEPVKLSKV